MSKNNLCVLVGPIFTRREYVADKEINDVIFLIGLIWRVLG